MHFSKTPLRLSFFGGGTDLKAYYQDHGGVVISTAINKYIYVGIKKNVFNDQIILNHFEKEIVCSVDQIKHDIIREALKLVKIHNRIEIISLTDVPLQGTGLGSSSSFTVGLLHVLFAYKGESIDPFQLAELASHIEIEILEAPIGKQDQYAAAFGGLKEYVFCRSGNVQVNEIELDDLGRDELSLHMTVFHTGIERKASSVLSDQKNRMSQNIEHLHSLKEVVKNSKKHFEKMEIKKIGEFLNLNWEKKKQLSEKIPNSVINEMYDRGMEAGAYGGKLLGAGGGGYFFFLCPQKKLRNLRNALSGFNELPVSIETQGSRLFRL